MSHPPEEPARHNARGKFFVVEPNRQQWIEIAGLIDTGVLNPVVAEILPLAAAGRL